MNNEKTDIDLTELKRTVDAIFDHLINDAGVTTVSIHRDADFYWEVPSDDLHLVQRPQPRLDIGRLSDDWEFLSAILKNKRQAVGLMLTHVAPLLRHLGEIEGR